MKKYVSPEIGIERFNTSEPIANLADWLNEGPGSEYADVSIVTYEITS